MVYVFRIVSPGSDLHGEEWTFQDTTYAVASRRAYARLEQTFSLASEERQARTYLDYLGEWKSVAAYEKAAA